MLTDQEWEEAVENSEYQSVVGESGANSEPVARALDNVYVVIEENVESESFYDELSMIPANIVRGGADTDDAILIIQAIEDKCSLDEEIVEACEESLEYLGA